MIHAGYIFASIGLVIGTLAFVLPQPSRRIAFQDRPGWWLVRRGGEFLIMWFMGYIVIVIVAFKLAVHEEHGDDDIRKVWIAAPLLALGVAIAFVFCEKWAWTLFLTTFVGLIVGSQVSMNIVLHLSEALICMGAVILLFMWAAQELAVRTLVTIQYNLGIAVTVTMCVVYIWQGLPGWLRDDWQHVMWEGLAIVTGTIVKVMYTLLYAMCMRDCIKAPSITLDSKKQSISGSL